MSNRPARITQAEIERAIRAAKKTGVTEVVVTIGHQASIRIPLAPDKDIAKPEVREQSDAIALDVWMAKRAP
jgi:2-iminoacetate synthase ThiH